MGNLKALVPNTKEQKDEHSTCAMCRLRYKKSDSHTTEVCRNRLHTQLRNEKSQHRSTREVLWRIVDSLEPLMETINNLPTRENREE